MGRLENILNEPNMALAINIRKKDEDELMVTYEFMDHLNLELDRYDVTGHMTFDKETGEVIDFACNDERYARSRYIKIIKAQVQRGIINKSLSHNLDFYA